MAAYAGVLARTVRATTATWNSSINIPKKLPYVLRTEAHILTTEGVAMMFERLSKQRAWLEKMGVQVENPKAFDETGAKMRRYQLQQQRPFGERLSDQREVELLQVPQAAVDELARP